MHWVIVDWAYDHQTNVCVSQAACAHILVSPILTHTGWPHVCIHFTWGPSWLGLDTHP